MIIPCVAIAQNESENAVNSKYHDDIVAYLRQDLQKKEKQFSKQAERILVNLPNNQKLYDETFVKVKLDVDEGVKEDGTPEMNLVYSISYNCKHIEGVTDDYPSGTYNWNQSNSCRAICMLTKNFVEGAGKEFFPSNSTLTLRIQSTTDKVEITHIPYNGEYGDFRYCPVTFNGENVRISVDQANGINNNAQLAYIRTQSVKRYIEDNIPSIKRESNQYEFVTINHDLEGGQYRRSSIEIVVHGYFDKKAKEMIDKLTQDDYVDFNIPSVEPNSNFNTFALIIANEDYPSPLPSVPFATNDGNILYKYCLQTLGIPERHVKLIPNASKEQVRHDAIRWVKDVNTALNGQANIIVYYAGHGTTDADYKPYLIPCDVNLEKIKSLNGKKGVVGTDPIQLSKSETKNLLSQCIAVDTLCGWFNKVATKSITFIFDASFNGTQRNGNPLFSNKISAKKIKPLRVRNDILIFSSSEYNKTSFAYDDQHHGFFTYFILKELKRTVGDISFKELFDNVTKMLSYESSLQGKLQQPTIVPGGKLKDTWEGQRLK
ncbi:MAG: caspase family protein [Bacteroidales bacterium]|nr:caspase family protein [Candidatus Colimorpha onthohippi]